MCVVVIPGEDRFNRSRSAAPFFLLPRGSKSSRDSPVSRRRRGGRWARGVGEYPKIVFY
jgi:hypothetical protein